ncbi:MAG: glycyl-radical enzyme activating protein [Desulfomonilia bacterium]|jgi:pyruvate formate lyase activating enzyme|nr:glycyl-radical enzyme activating protein [Desulfomonilia bacterium]
MNHNTSRTENDKALIFEVKGNSLDDGPGIRTVVFFKGCPLNCLWCHNPESKKALPEISFDPEKCVGCDSCLAVCPEGALDRGNPLFVDRTRCTLCMECARVCPGTALSPVGGYMSMAEVMAEIEKDLPFFQASGGGVTLSGGEPTLFMEFASRLLKRIKQKKVHTLLETCGFFDWSRFMELLYPHLDAIYYDLKLFDPGEHRRFCGVSNETILQNFAKLSAACARDNREILPRIPLVPGITATRENLGAFARFLKDLNVLKVALLPYNPLWISKLPVLGQTRRIGISEEWMTSAEIKECTSIFPDFRIV